ncbi:MAG: type II secretion system protein GspF [Gammaproteobacteria bacterium SG8_47]|nr:MAG: type II secretion system protein GspF [Gammaproteobacteria bacterium SG8_47]
MGAFEYSALDSRGRETKGLVEGDSPRQVRQLLRDQGLIPLNVGEVSERETESRAMSLRRGVSATALALMTRQLATLSRSGLPLEEALSTVSRQTEKGRLKSLLLAVRGRVREGHSLAEGLSDFPRVFPELYRATVAAGEQSGHLDLVLERLADYTESRQQLRQKIQLALFYPAMLTGMAILVVVALLTYVVPEVVQVFENTGQQLPLLTRVLIATSDFLRDYMLWIIAGLVLVVASVRYVLRRPGPKRNYHRFLLAVPVISRLNRGVNTARFARTLSILAASGVPVLESMRIAGSVMSNVVMREAVAAAALRVREGTSMSKALDASGYFPPMLIHLIASGEASGNLEEMLERASVNQERELETVIATLMGLFEPLLILAMGAVVLLIVLAILLPIFDLNQLVR